jgi:glycosyltransferase involved in cell wall biosynthesis
LINNLKKFFFKPKIVYISGEPNARGNIYRVIRYAQAAKKAGFPVEIIHLNDIAENFDIIRDANIVIIFRAIWTEDISTLFKITHRSGARVVFDIDDLVFKPEFARVDLIDAIRSRNLCLNALTDHFTVFNLTYSAAQFYSAPTEFLCKQMTQHNKPSIHLPNGFDEQTLECSRQAVKLRKNIPDNGLIRIGYASGTPTHQKDFSQIAPVIARVLSENQHCRLVLFYSDDWKCLDESEFPELESVRSQIEWRKRVPLLDLPKELARFDINVAPLVVDNIFCNAKSELKYFEAALVGVPTIASPTEPFRQAVTHGHTGFLADTSQEWYDHLTALVNHSTLRQKIGRAAYKDVLWKYGPKRRVKLIKTFVKKIMNREPAYE